MTSDDAYYGNECRETKSWHESNIVRVGCKDDNVILYK